jgi:hypothetical protein
MIRIAIMTSLAGLFSASSMNYAAAQFDCSTGDIACRANCQMLPPELRVGCQTYCIEDREECEERAKLNERALLEKQQRRREEEKQRSRAKKKRKQ